MTVLGQGLATDRRHDPHDADARRLDQVLVDGFFPQVARDEMPARDAASACRSSACRTRPTRRSRGISRVPRASGGTRHGRLGSSTRPERHGVPDPRAVQRRRHEGDAAPRRDRRGAQQLARGTKDSRPLDAAHVLDAPDLDLAVARGAACYGLARAADAACASAAARRARYYIGIESAMPAVPGLPAPLKALCVVPFGMEEGTSASIPGREFGLVVGEAAEFRFLTSTIRKTDAPGALIEDWGDDLEELGPLEVMLHDRRAARTQLCR